MNAIEIDKALADIVLEKRADCQSRLDATPKENKGERKALQIELGMYALCLNAGFLWSASGRYETGGREKTLQFRRRVIGNILHNYPETELRFRSLDADAQDIFLAALQAEIFLRDQMYHGYLGEREAAQGSDDVKSLFELNIKIGAVESVFAAWEAWRGAHDICPHMMKEGLI